MSLASSPIRIAGGQGFYGDSPAAALAIAAAGAADYIVHDALAELTLSILQKDRMKNPDGGYARDIELLAKTLYPLAFKKGIRIVTNSGGLNPAAAAKRVLEILAAQGISGYKVAIVYGDDVLHRLAVLQAQGVPLNHLEDGRPLDLATVQPTHANVYIGAAGIRDALAGGAHLILAGRVADPCLTLGILCHHYGWKLEPEQGLAQPDLDLLAAGIGIGHLLECGGQASGGNSYAEWPMDYPIWNLGYPIAAVVADGTATFCRLEGQGGIMTANTLREQLVYEVHDPAGYITPDVTADFTGVKLEQLGPNEVRYSGAKGRPRPDQLKLAMGLQEGYLTDQFFFFAKPWAYTKALKFVEAVKEIWSRLPAKFEKQEISILGQNGIFGDSAAPVPAEVMEQLNEVGVRLAVTHKDPRAGKMAMGSVVCLGLNGPPGLISVPGWGNDSRIQLSLWPTLVPRHLVPVQVEWLEI